MCGNPILALDLAMVDRWQAFEPNQTQWFVFNVSHSLDFQENNTDIGVLCVYIYIYIYIYLHINIGIPSYQRISSLW